MIEKTFSIKKYVSNNDKEPKSLYTVTNVYFIIFLWEPRLQNFILAYIQIIMNNFPHSCQIKAKQYSYYLYEKIMSFTQESAYFAEKL